MGEVASRKVIPAAAAEGGTRGLRAYDFRHPDRLSRRQVRALEALHREAAAAMASKLAAGQGGQVELRLRAIAQVGAQEFVAGLPRPTIVQLLSLSPLDGVGMLQLDLHLGFEMVNLIMGGRRESAFPERPLTELEWTVLSRPVRTLLDVLAQAWRRLGPLQLAAEPAPEGLHFGLLGQAHDPVLAIQFHLSLGGQEGGLMVALPLLALERAHWLDADRLDPSAGGSRLSGAAATAGKAGSARLLAEVPIRCRAELGAIWVTLAELRGLVAGDIVRLGPAEETQVQLVAGEGRRFAARVLTRGRRLAVEVIRQEVDTGARA